MIITKTTTSIHDVPLMFVNRWFTAMIRDEFQNHPPCWQVKQFAFLKEFEEEDNNGPKK